MRLRTQYNQGNAKAGKLLDLVSKPSEFITTILIGNNIANILLPTLVTTFAIQQGVNVGIASAILTITVIVFAEVFPKSVAATFPGSDQHACLSDHSVFYVYFQTIHDRIELVNRHAHESFVEGSEKR